MNWWKKDKLVTMFMPSLNSARLSVHDQITLFTSIRDFLVNGFSLNEAFEFCSLVHPELKESLQHINQRLSRGHSFAEGIKALVDFKLYCQVKIAEVHGDLIETLGRVGQFLKMKQRQKNKLMSLMMYPVFLLILLVGIIIAIRLLVTPQIQGLSHDSRTVLPRKLWIMAGLFPLIVMTYILIKFYREQSPVWKINFRLKIPLAGPIYRSYYAYYLSSNLALMMSCGMDLQQIVSFMRTFQSNSLIRGLSRDVQKLIDRGNKLSRLRLRYHFLPRELMMMIDAGDTTKVLAQKLNAYSKLEFKLMTKRSSRVISFLQPAMFLLIGLIITGTYLSMLLPMYNSIKGVY